MKIEFNRLSNTIIVEDKEGNITVISCKLGTLENVVAKKDGKFKVANNVLDAIRKILQAAEQES